MKHVFEGEITPIHKAQSPFLYLPFDVPAGATRLTVRYNYSNAMPADESWGGNTLDLGLFGPGGLAFGAADFRGWSGSFRQEITITDDDATPAYLPGLPPGPWHVLLGIYNIAETGCRYRVQVEVSRSKSQVASRKSQVANGQPATCDLRPGTCDLRPMTWYKGDLHCHTYHSDGENSLPELTDAAKARGLDFLAITEHNTTSHLSHLAEYATPDFLPLPAEEITTYHGHANVWGIQRWVDFRCTTADEVRQAIALAHQQGTLFSINHPKSEGPPWGFGYDLGFDCMEVWQAPFWVSNYSSLNLWDSLLRQGRRIVAVGGSDLHRLGTEARPAPYPLGTPTTWVYAPALTQEAILTAIKQGHVLVTGNTTGPWLEFTASVGRISNSPYAPAMMGDEMTVPSGSPVTFTARVRGARGNLLRLVSARGIAALIPIDADEWTHTFTATPEALGAGDFPRPYLRAEAIQPPEADLETEPGALMVEALGNPIFVGAGFNHEGAKRLCQTP